jgi:osmotically-inducible protein OsmY
MNVLTTTKSKGVRNMTARSGRDAVKGAGRGARRGAKRGFGIGAMRGGAASVRDWIASDGEATAKEAKAGAESAVKEARKARATAEAAVKDARKATRKRMMRARVAAARTRASRPQVGGKKAIAAAGAAGAAGAYFLDPQSGTRRRHMLRDRAEAVVRRTTDRVRRQKVYRAHQAEGKIEALKSKARPEKPAANDQDLADRVKSEIFQPADAPKGSVNVNVENGIVYLRGHVDRKGQIEKLAKRARSVDGVRGVHNLLSA